MRPEADGRQAGIGEGQLKGRRGWSERGLSLKPETPYQLLGPGSGKPVRKPVAVIIIDARVPGGIHGNDCVGVIEKRVSVQQDFQNEALGTAKFVFQKGSTIRKRVRLLRLCFKERLGHIAAGRPEPCSTPVRMLKRDGSEPPVPHPETR